MYIEMGEIDLLSRLILIAGAATFTLPLAEVLARPASSPTPRAIVRRGSSPPAALPSRSASQLNRPPVLPPVNGIGAPPPPGMPAGETLAVEARLGRMLAPETNAYRLPDATSQWVGRLRAGQQVAIVSQWQGWFAIVMGDGSQAYVPQTHLEVLPYQVKSVVPVASAAPQWQPGEQPWGQSAGFTRAVIDEAFRYQDVPYVYGGNGSKGIDCSGLIRNCFRAQGVELPRRASEQATVGAPVPLDQMQPGDRLYFSVRKAHDHTGLYLGNGYFIHAARSRGKVTVDHLSTPLYGRSLTDARR
jgi:hypothetical protein